MALLHPDKIVGVTQAILQRPITPRPSVAVAAQRVAAGRPLAPKGGKPNAQPGLIENLAFQLRDFHQSQHMNRMARMVDTAVSRQKEAAGGGFQNRPVGTPAPKLIDPAMKGLRDHQPAPPVHIHIGQQPLVGEGRPAKQMDRAKAAQLAAELAYSQER